MLSDSECMWWLGTDIPGAHAPSLYEHAETLLLQQFILTCRHNTFT